MGADGDLVAKRLARGSRCFVVWIGGAVGGYGWLSVSPEWMGEVQLRITPRAGEGYVWNCVTVPEHRRKGIFRSVLTGISNVAHAEGLKRLWIGSVAIPAEKAVGPSGFKPALHFTSVNTAALHWLAVRPSPDGDPALIADARSVLGVGGRPLRPGVSLRRSRPMRH
jgi:GNAT superfamily N-acetyltransferase